MKILNLLFARKSFLTLSTCVFIISHLNAQIQPLQKKFGGLQSETLWRLSTTPDENFISAGNIQEQGDNDTRDIIIAKFDINGEIINSWKYGNEDYFDATSGIVSLENGDFLIAGHSQLYTSNTGVDNSFVSRITLAGNVNWSTQFGNETIDVYIREMIVSNDEKILLAGRMVDTENGSNEKGVFIKMDTNGSILFRKEWDQSSDFEEFNSIVESSDGYLVTGYSDYLDPDAPVVPTITKFDFNGNLLWSNAYSDGSLFPVNNHLILENEDGTLITAFNAGTANSNSSEDRDIFIMKLNATGGVIWTKRLSGPGEDDIDNMILSHPSESSGEQHIIINGDLVGLGFGGRNGHIIQVSQNGELIAAHAYGKDGSDTVTDIVAIEENDCLGYLMVGATSSFNLEETNDAWIIKVDSNLGTFGDCFTQNVPIAVIPVNMQVSSIGIVDDWNVSSTPNLTLSTISFNSIDVSCSEIFNENCVVSVSELEQTSPNLEVYPNPNQGEFTVEFDSELKVSDVFLYDLIGNEIPFEIVEKQGELFFTTSPEIAGLFFLKIITNHGTISEKILIK